MNERSVKMEKVLHFPVLSIFDGGTIEDVKEKLDQEYSKLKYIIDEGKFITFGYDKQTNDTYIKIWRMETDREYQNRLKRIEQMNSAREIRMEKYKNK